MHTTSRKEDNDHLPHLPPYLAQVVSEAIIIIDNHHLTFREVTSSYIGSNKPVDTLAYKLLVALNLLGAMLYRPLQPPVPLVLCGVRQNEILGKQLIQRSATSELQRKVDKKRKRHGNDLQVICTARKENGNT